MKWLLFLIVLAAIPCPRIAHSAQHSATGAVFTADQSPFTLVARRREELEPLPFGAIRPEGWLETQIRANLHGLTGHLDSLAPDLIIKDDIFGKDRLTRDIKKKDVGALAGGDSAAEVQYLWWNSETQGNWRDGWIRSAMLTGDPVTLARARAYIRRILASQDRDGYLGIYDRDLRYHFDGENGELWAKTTLLRGLLAWYDYTRNPAVLTAVEKAVLDVMRHYPANASHPFYSKSPDVGGLSHGLMLTDVLESLYRLTGRTAYLDYALFLYKDFSAANLHEDAQYEKIIDPDIKLRGHGVHTYEHLRAVAAAAYASGNPALLKALDGYLHKIDGELTPSGAPAGDEWIGERRGNATTTGYEYCSIHELMDGYIDLLGKTGVDSFGDEAEQLLFNAAQGSRNPETSCIAYLKTDNSYYMTGGLNTDRTDSTNSTNNRQTRYKYSPVHQDVAVCCAPNAGRIAPYFVDRMWMRNSAGLVATLLGPCKVTTTWKGTPLTIREKTVYPNEFSFDFQVTANSPVNFTLAIRKPGWATGETISYPYTEKEGYYLIKRTWRPGESVHVHLYADVAVRRDRNNDFYFTHGPIVLARSITATAQVTRRYPLPGFFDYFYRPDNLDVYAYKGTPIEHSDNSRFEATLFDTAQQREVKVWLTPMGQTILRQVTFPGLPATP